ncbi:MAG: hypothetical protein RLZZ127_212 [Planctomycetota bacterium]|jgi:hypothetical protein
MPPRPAAAPAAPGGSGAARNLWYGKGVSGERPDIPGFTIHGILGQGGMATVWRAEQLGLGRQVALKVVLPEYSANKDFRARFLREAQACAKVNHPHVVGCYAAGEHQGRLYMALELLPGGDLLRLLVRRGGQLAEPAVLAIARDCLAGLGAIEAAGLIHRDLKPANIFLTADNRAKIADLGLARQTAGDAGLTMAGLIVGTPAYMPPEQARGETDLDIRSDLYALGATLFHLLTGEAPYQGPDPVSILVKVVSDPLPDPRDRGAEASPGLTRFLQQLTAKERDRRFACVSDAQAALEKLFAAMPAQPAMTPAPTPATRPTEAVVRRPVSPVALPALDPVQLERLVRRVVVDQGGCRACLILAPGASFPRIVLKEVLKAAGITYGVIAAAELEATRPSPQPRRLVIARGDPSAPGIAGRSVFGLPIDPDPAAIQIRITDDGMEAAALVRPGELVPRPELERELRRTGLRYGLDAEALRRLVEGPADPTGRVVVARGRPLDPGQAPGWILSAGPGPQGVPRPVEPGQIVATWDAGRPGRPGMDVLGNGLPAPTMPPGDPERLTGEGVEPGRDRDGRLCLRAARPGSVQRQADGTVRVVEVRTIRHDLTAADEPISGDAVVVIEGSVLAGARISTTNDVIITGDLADAHIETGGAIQVAGAIVAGDRPLVAAGGIEAGALEGRQVVAGSVRIRGTMTGGEIIANGAVEVDRVVGGRLVAAGTVTVGSAGDRDGSTTELWAGRNLALSEQARLAKLTDARLESERLRVVAELQGICQEADNEAKRQLRLAAGTTRPDEMRRLEERLKRLKEQQERAHKQEEQARRKLAAMRTDSDRLERAAVSMSAEVTVSGAAHAGVVVRLGDAEPVVLDTTRPGYRLSAG